MTYARPFRWVANLPQSPTSLQPSTDLPLRRRLLFAWCAVPFWCAFQEDMRGLHLEMIRELEAQRYEMRSPRDAISTRCDLRCHVAPRSLASWQPLLILLALVTRGRYEMRSLLAEEQREMHSLRAENAQLRQQVAEMRGPMGGLAQWGMPHHAPYQ